MRNLFYEIRKRATMRYRINTMNSKICYRARTAPKDSREHKISWQWPKILDQGDVQDKMAPIRPIGTQELVEQTK
jgi:hypothetical protein